MALFRRKKKGSPDGKEKSSGGQLQVIKDAFGLVKRENPVALIYCAVAFIIAEIFGIVIGSGAGHPVYFAILFLPIALLVSFFMFTRFANTAAFSSIEGQLGAGASVLMGIRRGFTTTPAVVVNKNQDMVHRSAGRCGIVLVGEGSAHAVRQMLNDEKRKVERFAPGVPVFEVIVGNGAGEVSLKKLQKHLKKFPKKLNNNQVREVRSRLKAIGGMNVPLPKGPIPTRAPKGRM